MQARLDGAVALTDQELNRRMSILKRFRELLKAQRERFQQYLEALDKQKDVIEGGNAEALAVHVELEEQIVADIFSIQKVIDPLENMYRASYRENIPKKSRKGRSRKPEAETGDISTLKSALEDLKSEAMVRTERNKQLLTQRMTLVREEIKTIRKNPYSKKGRSLYSEVPAPALIDIEG
ncbi:MAG: flagellar biosynthesis protein FlgN [Treponema sp.]|nr:flagellar biosynthesis protein FlgN [Treponema sp.]